MTGLVLNACPQQQSYTKYLSTSRRGLRGDTPLWLSLSLYISPPMEGSPATRLPEADALPDGFVESSSADQAPPISSAPAAGDPLHPALGPDHEGAACADADETLGAPSTPSDAADALRSLSMTAASEPERAPEQQGPAADIGGDLSLSPSPYLTH